MEKIDKVFVDDICQIIENARQQITKNINKAMVLAYWNIGKRILEEEQKGNKRAQYGESMIPKLSQKLTQTFGRGFSTTNLRQMRKFYDVYQKQQTVSAELTSQNFELSWSHYLKLMRITDPQERHFYEIEASKNNWSLKELQRQFDTALYTRLSLSKDKKAIVELSKKGQIIKKPKDLIKDPYILEFVGLPAQNTYSENDLETALINKLELFLLELGKGFTFVARQKRITIEEKHFYIDLVFYNRLLRCFILIDLKIGELTHQDLGQIQMYVNYYDRNMKLEEENKTVGIVLCQDKSDTLVEITLPKDNDQIFASRYQTVLPSKEELKQLITSLK